MAQTKPCSKWRAKSIRFGARHYPPKRPAISTANGSLLLSKSWVILFYRKRFLKSDLGINFPRKTQGLLLIDGDLFQGSQKMALSLWPRFKVLTETAADYSKQTSTVKKLMNQLIYFIMSYFQERCINLKTSFPWTSRIDATGEAGSFNGQQISRIQERS